VNGAHNFYAAMMKQQPQSPTTHACRIANVSHARPPLIKEHLNIKLILTITFTSRFFSLPLDWIIVNYQPSFLLKKIKLNEIILLFLSAQPSTY